MQGLQDFFRLPKKFFHFNQKVACCAKSSWRQFESGKNLRKICATGGGRKNANMTNAKSIKLPIQHLMQNVEHKSGFPLAIYDIWSNMIKCGQQNRRTDTNMAALFLQFFLSFIYLFKMMIKCLSTWWDWWGWRVFNIRWKSAQSNCSLVDMWTNGSAWKQPWWCKINHSSRGFTRLFFTQISESELNLICLSQIWVKKETKKARTYDISHFATKVHRCSESNLSKKETSTQKRALFLIKWTLLAFDLDCLPKVWKKLRYLSKLR